MSITEWTRNIRNDCTFVITIVNTIIHIIFKWFLDNNFFKLSMWSWEMIKIILLSPFKDKYLPSGLDFQAGLWVRILVFFEGRIRIIKKNSDPDQLYPDPPQSPCLDLSLGYINDIQFKWKIRINFIRSNLGRIRSLSFFKGRIRIRFFFWTVYYPEPVFIEVIITTRNPAYKKSCSVEYVW